jgi:hypothetical protein
MRTIAMKFPMIRADERGETHFGVQDIPERELAVGPPPNPAGQMSDFGAVTTMCALSFPAPTIRQKSTGIRAQVSKLSRWTFRVQGFPEL